MNTYDSYLKNEADYQDNKIKENPREKINKVYNDVSSAYRYKYRNILVGDLRNKHVLDLGCGNGFASIEALRAGAYVTAVDISPKSIEYLINAADSERLNERLCAVVMDAHNLAFENNTFDIVFGNGILHHLPDLDIALREIERVLKKNGYAVFLEPLGMNPFLSWFRKATPSYRTSDEQPLRMPELNLIKEIFPNVEFVFFDFATLLAKIPLMIGMRSVANFLGRKMIWLDDQILRRKGMRSVTFFQKMSWMVLMKLEKR